MNTRTDNTQDTAKEFRQAAKRLGDGAAHIANAIPWVPILKGTGKLAINIVRYSMGIAIYGLVIWPYRLLAPVAAGIASTPVTEDDEADMFNNDRDENRPLFPSYIDNKTGEFTLSSHDSYEYKKRWW